MLLLYILEHWIKYEKICPLRRLWHPPTCLQVGDFYFLASKELVLRGMNESIRLNNAEKI